MLQIGSKSPWGEIDDIEPIMPGMIWVATPSHGGIRVYSKLNKQIPEMGRNSDGWYEEDCDWAIPYVWFNDEILNHARSLGPSQYEKQNKFVSAAVETIGRYNARLSPCFKFHGRPFLDCIIAYKKVSSANQNGVYFDGIHTLEIDSKGEASVRNWSTSRDNITDIAFNVLNRSETTNWVMSKNGHEYETPEQAVKAFFECV